MVLSQVFEVLDALGVSKFILSFFVVFLLIYVFSRLVKLFRSQNEAERDRLIREYNDGVVDLDYDVDLSFDKSHSDGGSSAPNA